MASSPTGRSLPPGRRSTTSSRRSPVPWPCNAESGMGSPRPRRWNSSASASRRGSSSCSRSRAHRDGRSARSRRAPRPLASLPLRVDYEEHEIRLLDRLPRLRGNLRTERPRVLTIDAPGVDHAERDAIPLAVELLRSRVTPGVSWTTAARDSVRRLTRVDLPTFGKPTIATVPATSVTSSAKWLVKCEHLGHEVSSGQCRVARAAERVELDEPLPELVELALDLERGLLVALAPRGSPRRSSAHPRRPKRARSSRSARCGSRGSPLGSAGRTR